MHNKINQLLSDIDFDSISKIRQGELEVLIDYIQLKKNTKATINLNFICTHNSRRSQFAQLWAKVAAIFYHIDINSYSGGVEVTEFNKRAIQSLNRFGFEINKEGDENPRYFVRWDTSNNSLPMYSKLFDHPNNPSEGFAAIMTCSHADENCPFVAGCEQRIPIRYDDPKTYDNTPLEAVMYDERSFEIASEMMFVFSKIK